MNFTVKKFHRGDVFSVLQHFSEAASTVPAWRQRWERLERQGGELQGCQRGCEKPRIMNLY